VTDRINYVCQSCGAADCKLWRDYQSFRPRLLCVICAGNDQFYDVSSVDADGLINVEDEFNPETYKSTTIGWLVPAVPTPEWNTYWGYSSIPEEGLTWWRYLPSTPEQGPFDNAHH
jgi:hypothetical protein